MNPNPDLDGLTPEYLGAFVDGELTAEERGQVLARLAADPEFRRRVCELRTLKDMVKGAYAQGPAVPGGATARKFAAGGRQMLAAGFLVALGLGSGWLARDHVSAAPAFDRLAGLPEGFQAVALSQAVDPGRIILHLDSGDPKRLDQVLDLAEGLIKRHGAHVRVEIIANSYGLDLLRADVTPLAGRIADMARRHANLSFVACGQTVARLKREGVHVHLVREAHTASSAINAIMTRMGQGWVYVKV